MRSFSNLALPIVAWSLAEAITREAAEAGSGQRSRLYPGLEEGVAKVRVGRMDGESLPNICDSPNRICQALFDLIEIDHLDQERGRRG